MENSVSSNFPKTAQALASKAAHKVHRGVRSAQGSAEDAVSALSSRVEDLRSQTRSALKKAARRAKAMRKQGTDAITDVASQARDVVSNASDSIVAYTKKNPAKALALAATSGALLYATIKAFMPSSALKRTI
jgi:ElaB/YqjD/DUF883 family membrane-anchored ribosome-binding protein